MVAFREAVEFVDYFDKPQELSATPGRNGWAVKVTTTAGTPTHLVTSGVGLKVTLDSDDEIEVVTVYHKDVLLYDPAKLHRVEFDILVAAIDSLTVLTWGLGSAQADDEDAMDDSIWFKMEGATSTTVVVLRVEETAGRSQSAHSSRRCQPGRRRSKTSQQPGHP